jgi:chromate transporter
MSPDQALTLLLAHLHLSLLSVGGAMTLAPELHRLLVTEHGWIAGEAFTRCVTLAQALPGPNVLYIALLGWQVGLATAPTGQGLAAAWGSGALGLACSLVGVLLPSSVLACAAAQLQQRWADHCIVQAFRAGMAPVVVAALLGSGWVVGQGAGIASGGLLAPALAVLTAVAMACSRVHLLWLLLAGALTGACAGAAGIGLG